LRLSISPLTVDGNGAPFLRFINHKFDREVMIPVSDQLEKRLREQSERTLQQRPTTPWLFPRLTSNHDGLRCMSYGAWKSRLADWLDDIELKDELRRPVRV